MKALLLLALIVTCHGAGARIHREVHEQQKLVQAASYPSRRSFGNPTLMDRSLKTKSRVFRNAQVQVDDEPRLFRASGRFQKRVVAAAPHHDTTTVPPPPPTSSDSSAMYAFSYDESSHHMNKMTEDNKIMEEAAEYAKGLERTTVAVRGDEEMRTTVPPTVNSQNVPAIITPRAQADERRQQFKQPPPAFPQKPPMGRPQQDIFTNTVNTQTIAADPMLPPNRLVPTSNALQNVYHPPALGQASAPVIQPFTLPPAQSPAPIFPGLITPQVAAQVPQGIAASHGSPPLQNSANPGAPQLNPMQQLPAGVHFPQGQMPSIPARRFVGPSQPPTQPALVLPAQAPLAGQIPPAQGVALGLPAQAVSPPPAPPPPPPPPPPPRLEIINGQAANSSLEQLGCGFDWLTNTCKDVFGIGWCGQCHDFGNIFVHDCKCVRPLIVLPPRQAPQSPQMLFRMI